RGPVHLVLHVPGQVDVAEARDADLAGVDVEPAPVARPVHGLRVDDVGPQPVVERQLRRGSPGVLYVIELAPLPLAGVRVRADEAAEVAGVPQQERGEPETAPVRPRRALLVEGQLAGAVRVARDPEDAGRTAAD